MDITPPYDGVEPNILDDETLAPLKRNHACLQCKKRKVKCDAVRPACNPCLRSHAHALRSAQRNKTLPPQFLCTYTEGEDDQLTPPDERDVSLTAESSRAASADASGPGSSKEKKKSSAQLLARKSTGQGSGGDKSLLREKDRRIEEERDTLRARIAELESKLARLSPSSSTSAPGNAPHQPSYTSNTTSVFASAALGGPHLPTTSLNLSGDDIFAQVVDFDTLPDTIHNIGKKSSQFYTPGNPGASEAAAAAQNAASSAGPNLNPTVENAWDFSEFLILPLHWPKNLPGPIMLEHLVETFFNHVPQLPRMIHRSNFMARLKLAPTHDEFPFPGLLHAMCAVAAPHTALTNSVPPAQLDAVRQRYLDAGLDLETCEDFGLAQAEAAERMMRHFATSCVMGPGLFVFDMVRANIILSVFYFSKGLPLRGWILGGTPGRLIHALELGNKNVRKSEKPGIMPEAENDRDREERSATVWMAFVHDAGFSINSAWSQSMDLKTLRIALPTSNDEFRQKFDISGFMEPNPQTAHDPDVLYCHPVPDPFVLVVKAAILISRVASWIREWQQRDIVPGDDMEGVHSEGFIKLNNEIFAYQLSIPSVLKDVYKILDSGHVQAFDVNLLSVHILPHVAVLLLHESFVDWEGAENASLSQMQKAYEAVVGFVHLIPSQLDITLVMTPLLTFCIYTVGRIVAKFVHRALAQQQFALAVRYRADLLTLQNILARYGAKFALGLFMSDFLDHYIRTTDAEERLKLDTLCHSDRQLSTTKISFDHSINRDSTSESSSGPSASSVPSLGGASNASPQNQSQSSGSSHVTPERVEHLFGPNSTNDMAFDVPSSSNQPLSFDSTVFEGFLKQPYNPETVRALGVGIVAPTQASESELQIPMCMQGGKLSDYRGPNVDVHGNPIPNPFASTSAFNQQQPNIGPADDARVTADIIAQMGQLADYVDEWPQMS